MQNPEMQSFKETFQKIANFFIGDITSLSASGSNRQYFRITADNGTTYIGVCGTSIAENKAFISISNHFRTQGIRLPKIISHSIDWLYYIQEDLGDIILFDYLTPARKLCSYSADQKHYLATSLKHLAKMQTIAAEGFDYSICYPQSEFNSRSVFWDLNYFKYCFLKPSNIDFQEDILENDFDKLKEYLLSVETLGFMFRDFQSRNIMIHENKPYFIDFQGGRKGPLQYDLVSFLWQAKAQFSEQLKSELIDIYLTELHKYREYDEVEFRKGIKHFVLFRTLQVLGAYGFRGLFERKKHFIESIPFALKQLQDILPTVSADYPYLCQILQQLIDHYSTTNQLNITGTPNKGLCESEKEENGLIVEVYSFSYKKGIPEDVSGNGGGYVFDCRAIHNPGKYEQYKSLTGLDKDVIDFLEDDGEITVFLQHIYDLTDKSVSRYIERGFSHLMISFGCTGGQHRSAYSAQHVAEHISKKFGVKVLLKHRELGINQLFERTSKLTKI